MDDNTDKIESVGQKALHAPCFTEDEKVIIKEMVAVYRWWKMSVKFFKGGLSLVTLIAAAVAGVVYLYGGGNG